jgi:uncharacterized protein YuzE
MSIRVEQYDDGEVLYIALDPDGIWARSDVTAELLTFDYNAQGGLIGIELLGSLAKKAATAMLTSVLDGAEEGQAKKSLAAVLA